MRRNKWLLGALVLGLPLALAALAYGRTIVQGQDPQAAAAFVCPLTGEELPCPNCCPMNGK